MPMLSAKPCNVITQPSWRRSLLAPRVWQRAACYGLPAALVQALLNQSDNWLSGRVTVPVAGNSVVSPLFGFGVAFQSAVTTDHDSNRT